MPVRYQETVHVHREHHEFLDQSDNKSKDVRDALDLLIEQEDFEPESDGGTEVAADV